MLTRDEAKALTDKVLSYSTFPECDVSVSSEENASIRFALNGITTSGYTIERSLFITSSKEGRVGTTVIDEFDDVTIQAAVKRTETLALLTPPNPEHEPALEPQKYPTVENFAQSTSNARNAQMIPHVRSIIDASKKASLVAAGFFERSASSTAIANKAGNFGYGRVTDCNLSTTVRTPEGTSSGWASQPAVRIEDIDGAAVGQIAVEKCSRWRNPKKLDPGKYTVVLEPTAVGDLVQLLGFNMQARAAEEGRSFLSKKGGGTLLGDKMFPEQVTLRTDPKNPLYSVLPWAGGNLPTGPMTWVENGVVKNLTYDRYYARKAGKQPTPFPGNLVLNGGDKSLADLIASVDRGLLVTRFWYIRFVNPQTVQLTGLTRDGLFLIEQGKVTTPVVNFRFNESPVRLLQNIVAMGKSVRVRGGEGQGMIAPPLVVKEFPFTSLSEAV